MKNDFWKSQFLKHEVTTGPGTPVPPKAVEEPAASRMERTLRAVRASQATLSFETFVARVLSGFPAKSRAQWEKWLLNQKAALMKKWNLSE